MRGQSSIEFILVLAAFLAVLSSFTIPNMYNSSISTTHDINRVVRARNSCDKITSAVNRVSTSENVVDSMWVSFPAKWGIHLKKNHQLMIRVKTTSGWENIRNEVIFAPDNDKSENFNAGEYLVVVERTENISTGEPARIFSSDNKIYLKLNPEVGGSWRN